jgi:excisionase family DNA binding protein
MSLDDYVNSSEAVISRRAAASLLKCDPRTVSRGIVEGSIPSISLGRRRLIPLKPFLRLLGVESEVQ